MRNTVLASLFCLAGLLMFTGCQKKSTDTTTTENSSQGGGNSNFYIKGKKDGKGFNYNKNAMAKISNLATSQTVALSLVANAKPDVASQEGLALGVHFLNGKQFATGSYREDDGSTDYLTLGVYNPNSTTISWSAGIHKPTVKPLKITITSLTDQVISGTFEGAFYKQDSSIPKVFDEYTLFTEGEFKLPVLN